MTLAARSRLGTIPPVGHDEGVCERTVALNGAADGAKHPRLEQPPERNDDERDRGSHRRAVTTTQRLTRSVPYIRL